MSRATDSARRRAREVAFRVAYQADLTADRYGDVWQALCGEERLSEDQTRLIADLVACLETRGVEVDAALVEASQNWSLPRLAATDRSVLRAATAELMARPGTPARVVLDEAIDIARRFGSDGSGGFVNGVLDRVARRLRPQEF